MSSSLNPGQRLESAYPGLFPKSENLSDLVINSLSYIIAAAIPGCLCGFLGHFFLGHDYLSVAAIFLVLEHLIILDEVIIPTFRLLLWRDTAPNGEREVNLTLFITPVAYVTASFVLQQLSLSVSGLWSLLLEHKHEGKFFGAIFLTCYLSPSTRQKLRVFYAKFREIDAAFSRYRFHLLVKAWWCAEAGWGILEAANARFVSLTELLRGRLETRFIYRNLPIFQYEKTRHPREIRLVRIPATISPLGLQYDLVRVQLESAPSFEAISYTWGDPIKSHSICINGCRLEVTANVHDILRERSSWRQPRLLWIDSICINQKDDREKTEQVQLMRDIYQRASRVLVCLGRPKDSSKVSLLVRELRTAISFYEPSKLHENLIYMYLWQTQSRRWQALLAFFSHPWFDRVWVIQEVAVAREVQVRYGGKYISWDYLSIVGKVLYDPEFVLSSALLMAGNNKWSLRKPPLGSAMISLMEAFREAILHDGRIPATTLFSLGCIKAATDPRDKVYAVLGISTTDVQEAIPIDYGKTVDQVYLEAAHYLISIGELFSLITFAGATSPSQVDTIPTWVPNFRRNCHTSGPIKGYYCATAQLEPIIRCRDPRTLVVARIRVDTIATLSDVLDFPIEEDLRHTSAFERISAWYEQVLDLCRERRRNPKVYGAFQSEEKALWRTLIGNRAMNQHPAPAIYASHYRLWESAQPLTLSLMIELGQGIDGKGEAGPADPGAARGRALYAFITALTAACHTRRFCVTGRGYMGLVPPGSRVGDEISLFVGAQMPLVHRRSMDDRRDAGADTCESQSQSGSESEPHHNLVRETYLHGIMRGELVDHGSDLDTEDLLLR
jgi:Heterokaryon incompatibility protein (HET)